MLLPSFNAVMGEMNESLSEKNDPDIPTQRINFLDDYIIKANQLILEIEKEKKMYMYDSPLVENAKSQEDIQTEMLENLLYIKSNKLASACNARSKCNKFLFKKIENFKRLADQRGYVLSSKDLCDLCNISKPTLIKAVRLMQNITE
jgi:hypothetical protein